MHRRQWYMSGREYVIDAVVDAFWPKIGIRA